MERLKVAILPAGGAFGTALSVPLFANGHNIVLVFRSEKKAEVFGQTHQIERLKGVTFPKQIHFTADVAEAVGKANLLILASPARYLEKNYLTVRKSNGENTDLFLLLVTKGLIKKDGLYLRPSELIAKLDPDSSKRTAVLSGPNFAWDVARNLPFASVIASQNTDLVERVVNLFQATPYVRMYASNDLPGVEYGGAFKNVIAIAAGVSDGLNKGESARTALVARGANEIVNLAVALGGKRETVMGLSGIGDLWMTSVSLNSRNHQFGEALGQGVSLEQLLNSGITYEGYDTCKVAWELARQYEIRTPIIDAVYGVLYQGATIDQAVKELLDRKPVYEDGRPLLRNSGR